ncbi:MAG: LysR family transcriptional regulator [Halothiobacillus sp.]
MPAGHFDHQNILAFLAVAETGSFSAAASKLFITQPAVSKRIALLEQQMGLALFERLSRQISLTEAGEELLPAARAVRQTLEDFASAIARENSPLKGRLPIALSHYAGLHLLPAALTEFSLRYPAVLLDLRFMDSEAAIIAVSQGTVRLAYGTLGPGLNPQVHATPIWRERLVPMCATRHAHGKQPTIFDLARTLPAILPAAHTSTRQSIDCWLKPLGVSPLAVIEVNQLDSIALLVGTGIGWSVLPETLLNAKLMRVNTPEIAPPERALGLILRASGDADPAVSTNPTAQSVAVRQPGNRLAQAFIDTVANLKSSLGR